MLSGLSQRRGSVCTLGAGEAGVDRKVAGSITSVAAMAPALMCALLIMAVLCGNAEASTVTYGFGSITETSQIDSAIGASQITVDTSNGGSIVTFTFRNEGPEACAISEVYFDDGTLLELTGIDNSDVGVTFRHDASPPDLPGGQTLNPPFEVTVGFLAEAAPPAPKKGVNPGESLGIIFGSSG